MPDFGIFRGFNEKLFGDKLVAGQLPTQLGLIGSEDATGIDADAQAFFDRVTTAGGSLSATEQGAINTLVVQMKADGIWSKMKAIYPMVGASAAACAQNLKSSSFTGTFTSGWTFASTGATPNGTSAYMDSGFIPLNDLTSASNAHISFYSRTDETVIDSVEMGAFDTSSGTPIVILGINSATTGSYKYDMRLFANNNITNVLPAQSPSQGFALNIKNAQNTAIAFWNNTKIGTVAVQDALTNKSIYIAARNSNGSASNFSGKECSFSSIGNGLTDTEASDFYTAVQAFQTTLSREV